MSEMVERVERAICEADRQGDRTVNPWDQAGVVVQRMCRLRARAAIAAMRKPTDAMVLAACAEAAKEQVRPIAIHRTDAGVMWQAMIDEALK